MPLRDRTSLAVGAALLVGAVALAVSCNGEGSLVPPGGGNLALGTWGGDNAGLIATDSLTHVHIGCTFGDIVGTVALDASGAFVRDGSYLLRAYPIAVGPTMPARFTGRVIGRTLTLSIAVNDTVEKKTVLLGPVTITYGKDGSMGPCPICRTPRRDAALRRMPSGTP
jgi:hypothetical protein